MENNTLLDRDLRLFVSDKSAVNICISPNKHVLYIYADSLLKILNLSCSIQQVWKYARHAEYSSGR